MNQTVRRKIRVLQIIGSMHIGGAEQVVVHLGRRLDRERFDVGVCCTSELGILADRLSAEGVDVQLVSPGRRAFRHLTPLTLGRHLRRWKPDVIHTHGGPALLHAGPLAPFRVLPPWVHTFHFGNYTASLDREQRLERWFCGGATQLISVSDTQRAALIEHFRVRPGHIRTVLNGVEENRFVDDGVTRDRKRAELGIGPHEFVVGCIAVLSRQKGIPHLLEAATRLLPRHASMRLVIIGGGPDEAQLRRAAETLGFGPRILFTSWRADSQELLTALDLFVMPSLWEAMSMMLLEAMAARRPIVVTDVGENRAVVDGGRCAVVIPAGDAPAIVGAVEQLVADPGGAREMAARAQQRFGERFTTGHMLRAYEQLYADLSRE
ncbi:MAG: glycosyltransferase [Acidobacteria bacterium]|nr:glycosyltransferase [Acidobacteriota bacterium]